MVEMYRKLGNFISCEPITQERKKTSKGETSLASFLTDLPGNI